MQSLQVREEEVKVGRPRMPASKLSVEGVYKRNQRQYGTKPGTVLHHVGHDKGLGTKLKRMTRAEHAAHHNKSRRYLSK